MEAPRMFANHSRLPLALSLVSLCVAAAPLAAVAQYRQPGAASNPNLRRPVPVAAKSVARPAGVMPAARQVPMTETLPGERLPPPSRELIDSPTSGRPPSITSAQPEIVYDEQFPGAYDNYGYQQGGYYQPNQWCGPVIPMLGCMQLSIRGEFLYWWTSDLHTPPLATTSPANVDVDDAGVLGVDGTSVLLGQNLNGDIRPGLRLTANLWFDQCQKHGLEIGYTVLQNETTTFGVNSDQIPVIARPFFNVETGESDSELVAFPNQLTGSLAVGVSTMFHTGDIAYRWNACCDPCRRVDLFVGYRGAYLKDRIAIRERLTSIDLDSGIVPGTTITVTDGFQSTNYFNGVELGVALQRPIFCGTIDGWLKTSLGNTHTNSVIAGRTQVTANGQTVTTDEGFLALPTNIGNRSRDQFSTLVELGGKWNYDICAWRASVGYSVLFWSCVGRGGDLIDLQVNTSQLPPGPLDGTPAPRFQDRQSCFWAQGVTFGLERCW
jgi:hypothetical protein